jgi:transposase InsO family protein
MASTGRRHSEEQIIAILKEAEAVLNVMDMLSREALASEVDSSLPAARVIQTLETIALERGYPLRISLDNGPELRSRALDQWAYEHGVVLDFIQPGRPIQYAVIQSFNGRMRDVWLNSHGWRTIAEAQAAHPSVGHGPGGAAHCSVRDAPDSGERRFVDQDRNGSVRATLPSPRAARH